MLLLAVSSPFFPSPIVLLSFIIFSSAGAATKGLWWNYTHFLTFFCLSGKEFFFLETFLAIWPWDLVPCCLCVDHEQQHLFIQSCPVVDGSTGVEKSLKKAIKWLGHTQHLEKMPWKKNIKRWLFVYASIHFFFSLSCPVFWFYFLHTFESLLQSIFHSSKQRISIEYTSSPADKKYGLTLRTN